LTISFFGRIFLIDIPLILAKLAALQRLGILGHTRSCKANGGLCMAFIPKH